MTGRIKNWHQFQHFSNRRPPWIKLYRDLLDDPDWHALEPEMAKRLVALWLIASEDQELKGTLPDRRKLAFRLRISEQEIQETLEALTPWVSQDDINATSDQYHVDTPERETEGETETEAYSAQSAAPTKGENGKSRKKPAVSLPDHWVPSAESVSKAKAIGLSEAEVSREAQRFRNHAAQNDRRAVRWDAAFDNWCIKAGEILNRAPPSAKTPGYSAAPGSAEFEAWRTHMRDSSQTSWVAELDKRRMEGRAFDFPSQWPPGYQPSA